MVANTAHESDGRTVRSGTFSRALGLRVTRRAVERTKEGSGVPIARRAWTLGVRTFEVGGEGDLTSVAYALARTLPELATEGQVLLDLSDSLRTHPRINAVADRDALRQGTPEVASVEGVLGGRPVDLIELQFESPEIGPDRASVEPSFVSAQPGLVQWFQGTPTVESLRAFRRAGVSGFNVSHSLLDPLPSDVRRELAQVTAGSTYVRDALAGGRLLGGGLPRVNLEPPGRPVPLRELEQYWAPVTRLGFLTSSHERTLPQAGIQYIQQTLPAGIVLLDLPGPERLAELVDAPRRPALTSSDLNRLSGGFEASP